MNEYKASILKAHLFENALEDEKGVVTSEGNFRVEYVLEHETIKLTKEQYEKFKNADSSKGEYVKKYNVHQSRSAPINNKKVSVHIPDIIVNLE